MCDCTCGVNRKVSLGTCFPPGAIWHLLRLDSVKRCDLCSKYIANKCVRCHFEYELWSVNLLVGFRVWTQRGSGVLLPFICFELCGETVWKQSGFPDRMHLARVLRPHIKSDGKLHNAKYALEWCFKYITDILLVYS